MNKSCRRVTCILAFLAVGALSAGSAPAQVTVMNGTLVGAKGMTLYTFDKDPANSGKSACNGACAKNWPPAQASGTDRPAGGDSIITRDDGTRQWAHKGKPLYYFAKDQKPGDMKGDGVGGVWHTATP